MAEKRFWLISAILLAVMAVAQFASAIQESQTWDEAMYIAGGYRCLRLGDYRLISEHPPLARILQALPLLLFLHPGIPDDRAAWKRGDHVHLGNLFLYGNRVPADTLLLAARSVTIALTMLLGMALAWWTRKRFGPPAALFALCLFAFDPNIIAHGHYASSDLCVTLFIFLACILWDQYLEEPRTRNLVLAGIALGLALVSKVPALILLPVFLLLYLIRWCLEGRAVYPVRSFAVPLALAAAIVLITYAPDPFAQGRMHRYVVSVQQVFAHNGRGHDSYLLGRISKTGWWYYFPVVFAVKTPVATLAALAVAACLWPVEAATDRRSVSTMMAPALVFFAMAMNSSIDIGVRHILPIYPFLFVFIGGVLFQVGPKYLRRAFPAVVALLLCLLVAESLWIYPHYTAFFNFAAGGPEAGPRYLLDSNLDWGQDVENLKHYMDAHHLPYLCTAYFGNANFPYYKIPQRYVPKTWESDRRNEADCVAAVSATILYGLYVEPGSYRWLRERTPIAKIGYTIYLYDLRKR